MAQTNTVCRTDFVDFLLESRKSSTDDVNKDFGSMVKVKDKGHKARAITFKYRI